GDGDSASGDVAIDHAESLVSPSGTAVGVFEIAGSAGAGDLWTECGRESFCVSGGVILEREGGLKAGRGQNCFWVRGAPANRRIRANGRARIRMKAKDLSLCFQGCPPHERDRSQTERIFAGSEGFEEV